MKNKIFIKNIIYIDKIKNKISIKDIIYIYIFF